MEVQENKLLSTDINKLLESIHKNEFAKKFKNIKFIKYKESYSFYLTTKKIIKKYIIFEKSIKVEIIKSIKDAISLHLNIKSNLELYNFLLQNDININNIFISDETKETLNESINKINLYINNYTLKLKINEDEIPKITFINECLNYEEDYLPNIYSDYFFEYFPSEKEKNINEKFNFINSEERDNIRKNVFKLADSQFLKKYKITGPFSTGKSMTLFKISKSAPNIIYINLKIVKNQNNYYEFLKLLFSECSRIWFDNDKCMEIFNKKIKLINLKKNNLQILIEVIKILLDLVTYTNIVLILDQYKKSNIDYDSFFNENIENLNETKNLKIVYCSSINDNEIRDNLMPTFKKMQSKSFFWNESTQDYYFYFIELYKKNKSNDILYILFNNKVKYINMIKDHGYEEGLKLVDKKIENKLIKFEKYRENSNMSNKNYNLADILLFLKVIINQNYPFNSMLEILSVVPLKFFMIDIKENYFIVKPLFPYMIYFISEYVKHKDSKEYFIKEKYKDLSFLSNKVKGEYFEYSAKIGLKQILKKSSYKIDKEVYVDQIAEMNEITTPFDYFISSLKSKEEKLDEEFEEIDFEENKKKSKDTRKILKKNNLITINLDKKINEKEIREKIRNNYINDLQGFNIFEKHNNDLNKDLKGKLEAFGMNTKYIEKILFREIFDYRENIFENKVDKRLNDILLEIKSKKNNNKNKRIIDIPINKKIKKVKNNKLNISFNGNENLFINQTNTNGKVVDYAFLFGKKNYKILVTFQMKCYSKFTTLEDLFVNKNEIKEKISPMLLNSIKLFNCLICEWHYILVFYYNKRDEYTNYIGVKTLSSCFNKNIEYLLYDPIDDKFYIHNDKNMIIESKNLELITINSNLDKFTFNKLINIMNLKKYNEEETSNFSVKKLYDEGLLKFMEDFNKLGISIPDLQKKLKVSFLIYYGHFTIKYDTITPDNNFIISYKKKSSNFFLLVKNNNNIISYYDLEIDKNIPKINDLIDYEYKFSYILYFEENTKKRSYNDIQYGKDEFIYIQKQSLPKLNNK